MFLLRLYTISPFKLEDKGSGELRSMMVRSFISLERAWFWEKEGKGWGWSGM